jgi:hypothetical protein
LFYFFVLLWRPCSRLDAVTYSNLIGCFFLRQQYHVAFANRLKEARDSQWLVDEMKTRAIDPFPARVREIVKDEDFSDAKISQFVEKLFTQPVDLKREEYLERQKAEEKRRQQQEEEQDLLEIATYHEVNNEEDGTEKQVIVTTMTREEEDEVFGRVRKSKEEKQRQQEQQREHEKREAKKRAIIREAEEAARKKRERMGIFEERQGLPERIWAEEERARLERAEKLRLERLAKGESTGPRLSKMERAELEIKEARRQSVRAIEEHQIEMLKAMQEKQERMAKEKELQLLAEIEEFERKELEAAEKSKKGGKE